MYLVSQTATQRTRHSFGGKQSENADPLAGLPTKQFGLGKLIPLSRRHFPYTHFTLNQHILV